MATIFTKIINGELPAHKLAEDDRFLAFLDIRPITEGHTLVVPKVEVDYLFDLPDELLGGLHIFAKPVAKAIEQAIPCERIGTSVIGLEVPHAHLHLVPIRGVHDINFSRAQARTPEELAKTAERIRSFL